MRALASIERRWIACALAIMLTSTPRISAADVAVDPSERLAARQLGEEGLALYERGEYQAALDRFERALAVVPVPTLSLRVARCLERLGRLVEASERYRITTALEIDPDLPDAFRDTQAESREQARVEREALLARIPRARLHLSGAAPETVEILLDGRRFPAALLDTDHLIDPGEHSVSATHLGRQIERKLVASEGRRSELELEFAAAPAPAAAPVTPARPEERRPTVEPEPDRTMPKTLGYGALGLGAASLVVGATAWIVARGKADDLERSCKGGVCPADHASDLKSYETWKTVAIVGAVSAGVGLATGITVLVMTGERKPARPGMAFVTLSGRF